MRKRGVVYLVGAGPGDPGLITLRAVELLKRADTVVYDSLANEKFLSWVSPKAVCIDAGKRGSDHTLEQEETESILIEEAGKGKTVVRLKGGDPFVFGRGGEEAEALQKAGVPFEVVPGITSAIAAPTYAGIPVTHRDFTSTVAFVTGHEKSPPCPPFSKGGEGGFFRLPWEALSQIGTVVFLMGVKNLPLIVRNLLAAGRDSKTPAAVIERGTLPRQKVVTGTLATIERLAVKIRPPAVTVVGDVVSLRGKLSWFEKKPLLGKRILVTRARGQASALSTLLEEAGAEVWEIPTIEIHGPASWSRLDRALRSLARYHWLVFTSVNGVAAFFNRLWKLGRDLKDLKGLKVAAIGPATAGAVKEKGIRVDTIAEEYVAEGLVRVLGREELKGKKILIPRAQKAREILVEELKRGGAQVDLVEAYRTAIPRQGSKKLRSLIAGGDFDLVTFASSSTVENFMKMAGRNFFTRGRQIPVASIGPVTSAAAKRFGLKVVIQPKEYTIPSLATAIVKYFRERERGRSTLRSPPIRTSGSCSGPPAKRPLSSGCRSR